VIDERFEPETATPSRTLGARPVALGCVRVGREIWLIMSRRPRAEEGELPGVTPGDGTPLCFCREVLADGRIRLGVADRTREASLMELLRSW